MNDLNDLNDNESLFFILENHETSNKKTIKVLKENYKDPNKILDLYEKTKSSLVLKQLATLKRFLIVLYNSKKDYKDYFDFVAIKNTILQLNGTNKEIKIIKKKKPHLSVKKIQINRIKSFLIKKFSDRYLIDKYIKEIFSCNNPKDFEKITENEILAHFDLWKDL
jgi:hypothetical protein